MTEPIVRIVHMIRQAASERLAHKTVLTGVVRRAHNGDMSPEFAEFVRRHTSVRLAKRLGVAHTTVLRWIRRGVPIERLAEVSRATGIPAKALRPDVAAAFMRDEAVDSE